MWFLYQVALVMLLVVAAPILLLRRGRHYLSTLPGRLGRRLPAPLAEHDERLWIHAVSVGEVNVARILVDDLLADDRYWKVPLRRGDARRRLLITTITPTGQALAKAHFGERDDIDIAYLPFDLRPTLARFVRRAAPSAMILVEGEYWPYLLRLLRQQSTPIYVVNGRVSDRSFRRLRRLAQLAPSLPRALFGAVDRFCMQTTEDAERLAALRVEKDRVFVSGNLKFEVTQPTVDAQLAEGIRQVAAQRPILVAGSTMSGEEEILLEMLATLRSAAHQEPLLIVAPRHPERWEAVATLVVERSLRLSRRSRLQQALRGPAPRTCQVFLLDSIGELAGLYQMADVAFIGGTLTGTGGHNPLEAAVFERPILVGPSMENFREMAETFDARRAWRRVADADELAAALADWLASPSSAQEFGKRAGDLVRSGQGARQRTLDLIAPIGAPR